MAVVCQVSLTDDDFFYEFIRKFTSKRRLEKKLPDYDKMIEYLEDNFSLQEKIIWRISSEIWIKLIGNKTI